MKYRLQIVLDRKEEARQQAALYLAEKKEILKKEQEELQRLNQELLENEKRRQKEYDAMANEGITGGLDANTAQQRLNFVKRLDHLAGELKFKITEQEERIQFAEDEVEEALQDLVDACRELKVMQKHKEKWQKQIKKEEETKEQNEMNEIGSIMYVENRSRQL